MSSKKRQPIPTVRAGGDQRGTLVDMLAPKNQAESWALLAAMRLFVATSAGFNCSALDASASAGLHHRIHEDDLEHMNVLRAMLARSEGLE